MRMCMKWSHSLVTNGLMGATEPIWKVEFHGIHEYLQLEQEYLLLH